jgi:tetratricopeptide (TPR) repeat protein
MIKNQVKLRLVGLICLVLWSTHASAADEKWLSPFDDELWRLYMRAGISAFQQGDYIKAERRWTSALREAETFGPGDPRIAASLTNLAGAYSSQAKYAKAEPLYRRSLAIREKALGSEHPAVAQSLNNLAELYSWAQARYAEAEPLYKRSLAIYEKALGSEHLGVANGLENYAALLRATNRRAEAKELETRAKAIRAKHAQENPVK